MTIQEAHNAQAWDAFLQSQRYRPFLQSWTMGDVYSNLGQEPVRLEAVDDNRTVAICFGHVVPAKRGRHIAIPYGPVISEEVSGQWSVVSGLRKELKRIAKETKCSFIRMSPFWPMSQLSIVNYQLGMVPSPLHLLAEHLWYLPLVKPDPWVSAQTGNWKLETENEILMSMRKTTRYLIRQAEKLGVDVVASENPIRDLPLFFALHEETRKRHGFTPYTEAFFRAQIEHFAPRGELTLYIARFQDEILATSIHMHMGGETSYHHGASTQKHRDIPASHLLQWRAIQDALRRGDHIYNFWGIAPLKTENCTLKNHPFAGVTTFKTGFGGHLLELEHCTDIPLSSWYWLTRAVEYIRKWQRGF